jgi:hypothetical protein
MINKSFDRMLPPIDFDGFKQQIEAKIATQSPQAKEQTAKVERIANTSVKVAEVAGVAIPPGLLGELAKFIYAASPRPVPEIALAGAIGLMSGIVGRTYNTNTNAGLNNYVLLLANTGTGKDSMSSGIDALMEAVAFQCPYANNYIGPSEIASGQALVKHVSNFQCFVSILGEFGIRIEQLSNARASSSERTLKRILLDIYTKSKYGQMFRGSIYADKDKNVEATKWPALSLIGDSQPERFYSILNEDMISEGLLPRFLIIEYTGPRPPLNKYQAKPSQQLVNDFASLLAYCESIMHPNSVTQNQVPKVIIVQCDPIAQKMLDDFDTYADKLINSANKNIIVELWSRAHLKALKLASLVAVGVNMFVPTVQPSYVEWAIDLVRRDIAALVSKFEKGLVGVNTGENKQQDDLVRIIRDFVTQSWDDAAKYCQGKSDSVLHRDKLVPYSYLSKRLIAVASFRNDRVGATNALKRSIQLLVDGGKLQEIDKKELISRYNSTQRAFVVSDLSLLDG